MRFPQKKNRIFLNNKTEKAQYFDRCCAFFAKKNHNLHSQFWTYLDERGGKHEVNLYHSPRDGKLLVQVDKQTVIATVHAHKGGRWTFMVEDELCDVVLFRRGIEFFMDLRSTDMQTRPETGPSKSKINGIFGFRWAFFWLRSPFARR